MEILTEETLRVWRNNPVTIEIINRVDAAILVGQENEYIDLTIDASTYGLRCAYAKGVHDGAKAFMAAFGNLSFETDCVKTKSAENREGE